jgi:hypothetical protein
MQDIKGKSTFIKLVDISDISIGFKLKRSYRVYQDTVVG